MAHRGYLRMYVLQILFRWGATSTIWRWVKRIPARDTTTVNGTLWFSWKVVRQHFNKTGAADLFGLPLSAEDALEQARVLQQDAGKTPDVPNIVGTPKT